jgi:hypothetical protein
MVRRIFAAVGALAVVAGLGISSSACDSGGVPTIDCTAVTPKPWSQLAILTKCGNCHASSRTEIGTADNQPDGSRHGATIGYDYDTLSFTKQVASQAQDDIAGVGLHLMPPNDDPRWKVDGGGPPPAITEAEKQEFYAWVQCGQPG